jgi:hypothetical protein
MMNTVGFFKKMLRIEKQRNRGLSTSSMWDTLVVIIYCIYIYTHEIYHQVYDFWTCPKIGYTPYTNGSKWQFWVGSHEEHLELDCSNL